MWSIGDAPSGTAAVEAIFWEWPTPDAGGERITSYQVQWRVQGANWSGNIVTLTNGCYLQTGLSATTTYEARVRATNSVGTGAWSDEGSATPDAEVVPPMPPADTAPNAPPEMPGGIHQVPRSILWQWDIPGDGGQRITSFQLQWREAGSGWPSGNIISGIEASAYTHTSADSWDYLRDAGARDQQHRHRGLVAHRLVRFAGNRGRFSQCAADGSGRGGFRSPWYPMVMDAAQWHAKHNRS